MVLAESRLIIANEEIVSKSNEIPALQKLIGGQEVKYLLELKSIYLLSKRTVKI